MKQQDVALFFVRLEEPVRQIAYNAGYEGSIVHRSFEKYGTTKLNAATGEWVNDWSRYYRSYSAETQLQ